MLFHESYDRKLHNWNIVPVGRKILQCTYYKSIFSKNDLSYDQIPVFTLAILFHKTPSTCLIVWNGEYTFRREMFISPVITWPDKVYMNGELAMCNQKV